MDAEQLEYLSPAHVHAEICCCMYQRVHKKAVGPKSLGSAEAATGKVCADLVAFWLIVHMLFHADTNSSV